MLKVTWTGSDGPGVEARASGSPGSGNRDPKTRVASAKQFASRSRSSPPSLLCQLPSCGPGMLLRVIGPQGSQGGSPGPRGRATDNVHFTSVHIISARNRLTNREIMTRAEIKSLTLNRLSQPGAPISPFYKDTGRIGLGPTPVTLSSLTTSAITLFPNKVTAEILEVRTLTYLSEGGGRGTQFNP